METTVPEGEWFSLFVLLFKVWSHIMFWVFSEELKDRNRSEKEWKCNFSTSGGIKSKMPFCFTKGGPARDWRHWLSKILTRWATQTSRTLFWMRHSVYILQKSTFKWLTVIVSDHLADTGECVLKLTKILTHNNKKTYTECYSQCTFLLQSSVTMRYIIASSVCYKTRWM